MIMLRNNTSGVSPIANENRTCVLPIDPVAIAISHATIYSILLIASLVGNSLLIYACLKSKTTIKLIITNQAVSDLLYTIVLFPREIAFQIKGSRAFPVHGWIGQVFCKISSFTIDVTIAVSTLSLILVAAERLVAVVFPTRYIQITVKKRRLPILCTWIIALAIHSPYFYTFRLDAINGEAFCFTNWEPAFNHELTHTRYYTALLFVVLIVPLVTVSILQTTTLLKLREDNMAAFRTSIANQRHKKKNKNLLKMSVVIVLGFALCWLPFVAFQFLFLFFPSSIPYCSLGITIFSKFVILFSFCHCIVNPCICFIFVRRIRIAIKLGTERKVLTFMETRL